MVHSGVARPAARGSRARNQGGMGCVCVSILVAAEKSRVDVGGCDERVAMDVRAS